ncbi:MAG: hypothetical protein CMJ89_18040 [Planctomycetes bacterium]|jgi:ABC-type transport system involved in multi-copper enzyme maturation permease subunit|nr:hypothetical protein [Planctomycetota bacterium]
MSSNRMSFAEGRRTIRAIATREIGANFDSGIAYVTTIAFALLSNSIFMNGFFLTGTVDMTGFFDLLPLLLAFFLPAISMRMWAEEHKQRTVELLLTFPVRPFQAVLGKYIAALVLYTLMLACSLPIPVMLAVLGNPDPGLILSGYLGSFLFGALFLAFGSLLSALTADQIVSFVTSTLVGFLFVLTGEERVVAIVDGLFPALKIGSFLFENFSALPPLGEFVRGVIELSSLAYFVLLSVLFLWTTGLVLEKNRG